MTADQNMLDESWVLWTSLGWWLGVLEGETLGEKPWRNWKTRASVKAR